MTMRVPVQRLVVICPAEDVGKMEQFEFLDNAHDAVKWSDTQDNFAAQQVISGLLVMSIKNFTYIALAPVTL